MFEYPDKAVNKYRRSWEEYFCWDSEHYALRVMRYAVCVMLHPSVHSVGAKSQLGVYCPWTESAFISLLEGALGFKQYIGAIMPADLLVEVQAARKLAAIYTLSVAA